MAIAPGSGLKAYAADAPKEAVAAAEAWLLLVDNGQYEGSWDSAAESLRNAVPKEQWVAKVRGIRGDLGTRSQKALKDATSLPKLPGAPDGEFVVMQFNSSFEKKPSAVEAVTAMKDKDGEWRVSGYYIK
jgi:hypothetical protein